MAKLSASDQSPVSAHSAHAAALAKAGLAVFPVSLDKRPLAGFRWRDRSTSDSEAVALMWRDHPDALPAIDCGKSGIVVIDLDRKPGAIDGVIEFESLCRENEDLDLFDRVPAVSTPSTGLHLYLRNPPAMPLGNSRGALANLGIDIRGVGGYVVAPGANGPTGAWEAREANPDLVAAVRAGTLEEPPEWLLSLLRQRVEPAEVITLHHPASRQSGARETAAFRAALEAECAAVANTLKGGRNERLNQAAFSLGTMVGAGYGERHEAESELYAAAQACGLTKDDGAYSVRATIKSGIEGGMAKPRGPLADREPLDDASVSIGLTVKRLGASASNPSVTWHGEALPARSEIIKGLLPSGEVALLAGQSGAGKTFIALDLAAALALGNSFFGHRVREPGGTLFLLGEGAGTIAERLEAILLGKLAEGSPERLPIAWHAIHGSLFDTVTQASVIALARSTAGEMETRHGLPLRLIVVDTLAACFAMPDENDAAAATLAMKILQQIHHATGALVIAVAHYGKSAETGVRGSSAFTASADAILAVHAERDPMTGKVSNRSIALTKSRWRDTGWTSGFDLEGVHVGHDEDGDDVWSCFVKEGDGVHVSTSKPARQSRAVTILLQALNASSDHAERKWPDGAAGVEVMAVPREMLRIAFYARYPADGEDAAKRSEAKRKSFNRALEAAAASNVIGFIEQAGEGWAWRR